MFENFKPLDPEAIQELLKGQESILSKASEEEQRYFASVTCPNCASTSLQAKLNIKQPFRPGSLLPNKILACLQCQAEIDPYLRIIIKAPTAGLG